MKHYIEIQRLRTQDVVVDDTLTLEKNTDAFIQGDIISITEKIDGANSSIYYDKKLDRLRCFIIMLFLMIFNEFSARKCDDKQRCRSCDYYVCVFFHISFMPFILFEAFLISILIMIVFIYNRHC